jgi:hypothetical protein
MFQSLDSDEFRAAMDHLASGMISHGQGLRKRFNGVGPEITQSLPDMTFITADQARELHEMIPGFKPWPVRVSA